ncbi:MAG: hypothetical protein AAFV19_07180 [Pseudomonadota bacterium]
MRTLIKANTILKNDPQEVARDVLGLGFVVLALFAGFMIPGVM